MESVMTRIKEHMSRKAAFVGGAILTCTVLLSLVNDVSAQALTPVKDPVVYKVNVGATALLTYVTVKGTTNLPDQTLVTLTLSRPIVMGGETSVRESWMQDTSAKVKKKKFSATMHTDEMSLLTGISASTGEYIEKVGNSLTVCATVSTGKDFHGKYAQTDKKVRKALGNNGEKLKSSPNAQLLGSATKHPSTNLEAIVDVPHESPILSGIEYQQNHPVESVHLDGFC